MDLCLDVGDYKLNIRAGGVIIHNNKVLTHKNINKDHKEKNIYNING